MSEDELSRQARSLWAKSDRETGESWLPLYIHMHDSLDVAGLLWDRWLPQSTKEIIARALDGDLDLARKLCCFLAGVHDIGKATPIFQAAPCFIAGREKPSLIWKPRKAGLNINNQIEDSPTRKPSHPIAGQVILEGYLREQGRTLRRFEEINGDPLACVIGAHHGRFPRPGDVEYAHQHNVEMGFGGSGSEEWTSVQHELIGYVANLLGIEPVVWQRVPQTFPSVPLANLIDGLVIMSDWIASNQDLFPLIPLLDTSNDVVGELGCKGCDTLAARTSRAWAGLRLTDAWAEPSPSFDSCDAFFKSRFSLPDGARPRPIQAAALKVATTTKDPGLLIIEAPMGEGKTEAALSAAEVFACRRGCGGVCVALPTMATTDAMFARVDEWLERLPHDAGASEKSIYLAHGKAQMNEQFRGIVETSRMGRARIAVDETDARLSRHESEGVTVSEWMYGRKKGMLANFVVCTVDQVLMGALEMKHLSLRQLAVANKVVIIDECHAYDIYMRQYLDRLLEWLGYWRTPVILLSATLPVGQRKEMTQAYLQGRCCSSSDTGKDEAIASVAPVAGWRKRPPTTSDEAATSPNVVTRVTANAHQDVSEQSAAYPLLTYTSGEKVNTLEPEASARKVDVSIRLISDDVESLGSLLKRRLSEGGCVGVVCDTVPRAQAVAGELATRFGADAVMLDHSRFMDADRMDIERRLRNLLGPGATRANKQRPELLIVVGTQVLEQSLDIDFDLLVTDVAPVDLMMQRLGRMHRHVRGMGECDRPEGLRHAECLVRGIDAWEDGLPCFARGLTSVYDKAALMESLAVLKLSDISSERALTLPSDISRLVRYAYSEGAGDLIPKGWSSAYGQAVDSREKKREQKIGRAQHCLLQSVKSVCENDWTLMNLTEHPEVSESRLDSDAGQRAVRDTQESVEVMLLRATDDGMALLPWVGNESGGIAPGSSIPPNEKPGDALAKAISQSAVRLPSSLCLPDKIDNLVNELEEGCGRWVAAWQDSPLLAGRLALRMESGDVDGEFVADIAGRHLVYSRLQGQEILPRNSHNLVD
jgi:CRISPR-associated endonuclease/helicase Cas3